MQDRIDPMFINHAADVLGDTSIGLSGSEIVAATTAYAVEHGVSIPHQEYPFDAGNKRTALRENLRAFPPALQFKIIRALCEHRHVAERNPDGARKLKLQLLTRYGHLASEPVLSEVSQEVVDDTRHWLESFPDVQELYNHALEKYRGGVFERNVLDDLRLALELLLREVLGNDKSLENQIQSLGGYLKDRGGSTEFRNMFMTLVRYYSNYQNEHVKHNDAVIEDEVEFVIEITSSFMKHLVRMAGA
jgi:hypothetical protein